MRSVISVVGAFVGLMLVSAAASADSRCALSRLDGVNGRPFDATDGRDPRNYPPDPQVDFTWLALDIDFSQPETRSFSCEETIRFTNLASPLARLHLDGVRLKVDSVRDLAGGELKYHYDEERLSVAYDPPMQPRAEAGVVIRYRCEKPTTGMIFALPEGGYADRPLTIHTQGEAQFNRYWFFSHDSPNERCRTAMSVVAPAHLKVLSNGGLIGREELGAGLARTRYEMAHPHASYLVSLVLGDFDLVTQTWREKPVEYWVPAGQAEGAIRTFGRTPDMLEYFSRQLDFEYPYEKYAQAVCYLFEWGGMENTSTTTLREDVVMDERAAIDKDLEGLISHELAHQWFGDLVTCRSWPHVWLNEGFATYMEAAWWEHSRGRDDYDYDIWKTMRGVARSDRGDAVAGVVFPQYDTPDDVFSRPLSNPYGKGASVIHMLRRELGDDLFWLCIQTYLKRFAWNEAETDDLRKVIEEVSGASYERFFRQWLIRPGVPHIKVKYEWDDEQSAVKLSLEQTQDLSADRPAFVVNVPVVCVMADGERLERVIAMRERKASITIPCDDEPTQVCVDPDLRVLAQWDIGLSVPMRIRQALDGPTAAARLAAIATLEEEDRDDVRQALADIVRDSGNFYGERVEAAAVLGRMAIAPARELLLQLVDDDAAMREARVRAAIVAALGRYRSAAVAQKLLRFANSDPTYTVEERATQGLGRQDQTDEIIQQLLDNTRKTSHQDMIRRAAIGALAELDAESGIEAAFEVARDGAPSRGRPAGIRALGALGSTYQTERVRRFLLGLLEDRDERVVGAAIGALGALGSVEAIDELQAYAGGAAPDSLRKRARDAIKRIRDDETGSAALQSLRDRVAKLEERMEEVGHGESVDPNEAD
ncbi:MAG: HEAT repeat domain-containing protein [Phycisphaerales bacterium]|nr:HEAT repeat domain-containing protein [Phycisphaerales bacterium]